MKRRNKEADAPKQIQEPKCLDYNAYERPFAEHEQDTTNETRRPAHLLLPRKEEEGLLGANDEC